MDIFGILSSNAALFSNSFAQSQSVAPFVAVESDIKALSDEIKKVEQGVQALGGLSLAVYDVSARLLTFDAQLGALLGITV